MTRTVRYKALYIVQLVLLSAIVAVLILRTARQHRAIVLIILAVLLFTPGRIQGILFRHHFRGRSLSDLGRFEQSIRESEAFLAILRREPWRKRRAAALGVRTCPPEVLKTPHGAPRDR